MFFLLLTILCSSSIALILKYNASRKGHPLVMLTGNYFMASVIGAVLIFSSTDVRYSSESFIFGLILGLLFIVSFFIFAKAVELTGTALATVSSRLSVFIPVLLVILFFNEIPDFEIYIGFLLTILTILFFYLSLKKSEKGTDYKIRYLYLIAVMFMIGLNDFAMKFFQLLRPSYEEAFFVYLIFTTAFICGLLVIILRKIRINKKDLLTGIVLGIPNVFSTVFLLAALNTVPAMIAYPVMNLGVIVLTTVSAYIIWKEKLNKFGFIAILMGTAAILILSI